MNKRLTTDMADANGLQRAIRPIGFFNIKKMAADFCSTQCTMDNTWSLTRQSIHIGLLRHLCRRVYHSNCTQLSLNVGFY